MKKGLLFIVIVFCFITGSRSQEKIPPFKISSELFDQTDSATLGLEFAPGAESFTVFAPEANENHYNHGVVLYPFSGCLYAQWQSSAKDEDAPDTKVMYSRSSNGHDWSEPMELAGVWDKGVKTSGGWWSHNDTLVAFLGIWPHELEPRGAFTHYVTSTDGINWSDPGPVLAADGSPVKGIIEQDLRALPDGRILTAFHIQPGLVAKPFYTDDPRATRGWKMGEMENLPVDKPNSRELEPSWYLRSDESIVMVFRDQGSSYKKLASVSHDNGRTWTEPVVTNVPDSRAKQSAGNLPDGTAFQVSNPTGEKRRYPLVLTLSRDGFVFDKAFLLRSGGDDMQPQRYPGKYKRAGYSYPKSVIWNGCLYVAYATNKEDVELTRIPLKLLE